MLESRPMLKLVDKEGQDAEWNKGSDAFRAKLHTASAATCGKKA